MNKKMDRQKVVDIVKNYVSRCGGSVPLQYLLQDYKIAYKCDLPYADLGFASVIDFLDTLPEMSVFDEDGTTYVESFEYSLMRKERSDSKLDQLDDLSQLSIQMKNNLLLDCGDSPRVVKIQPSSSLSTDKKFLRRNNSSLSNHSQETAAGDKSLSSGSVHSLSTEILCENDYVLDTDNVSTYDYSYENNSSAVSDCQTEYADSYEHVYPSDSCQTISANHVPLSSERVRESAYFSPAESFQPNSVIESLLTPDLLTPDLYQSTLNMNHKGLSSKKLLHENLDPLESLLSISVTNDAPDRQSAYMPDECPSRDFSKLLDSYNERQQNSYASDSYPSPLAAGEIQDPWDGYSIHKKSQNTSRVNAFSDWLPRDMYGTPFTNRWPSKITDREIVSRIVQLVNSQGQSGGMDSLTIELKYSEMHSSALPKHWLNLLEESSALYIETLSSGVIIYPNRWHPIAPTSASLPAIRYPDVRNYWNITVSSYENTVCVWFRLTDEDLDLKYNILRREMTKFYQRAVESMKNLTQVTNGQLCAVHYRNEWYRGEVLESDSQIESVRCMLVDDGIICNFHADKIFELDEKFTNTPALAIQGIMTGLERWENCNYINCKVQKVLLKEQEIKVKIDSFVDSRRVKIQVYVQQNSQLLHLNFKMMEIARNELGLPVLYAGQMYDVIVLSVVENNSAQLQIIGPSLTLLEKTLQKVADLMKEEKNLEQVRIKSMFDLKLNKIYLARCEDGQWRRIVCRQFHLSNKVSALFIDYAEVKTVYLHDIFDTCIFPDTVSFIQPQSVLVKMLDVDAIVLKCLRNMQTAEKFSIKVLRSEPPALVQFFAKLLGGIITPVVNALNDNNYWDDIPGSLPVN